jgi:hypothetical protein
MCICVLYVFCSSEYLFVMVFDLYILVRENESYYQSRILIFFILSEVIEQNKTGSIYKCKKKSHIVENQTLKERVFLFLLAKLFSKFIPERINKKYIYYQKKHRNKNHKTLELVFFCCDRVKIFLL